jgi:ribosome biogenesis SPOUT family RNA methylase Rps3
MENASQSNSKSSIFIVEHLDKELEEWSALEYRAIAEESETAGAQFLLSSVPELLLMNIPESLRNCKSLNIKSESVEKLYLKDSVCLLDPAATTELSPADGDRFQVFLFGGILGKGTTNI